MDEYQKYEKFKDHMEAKYPLMLGERYGGFEVGPGWWPIIDSLCNNIQGHIDWRNETRERLLKSNPHNQTIPEPVKQVVVQQIKEKFGGLRFYYEGGDEVVSGMVRMAEAWANNACEECGSLGKRTSEGWIKTLCEFHIVEREAQRAAYARQNGFEE